MTLDTRSRAAAEAATQQFATITAPNPDVIVRRVLRRRVALRVLTGMGVVALVGGLVGAAVWLRDGGVHVTATPKVSASDPPLSRHLYGGVRFAYRIYRQDNRYCVDVDSERGAASACARTLDRPIPTVAHSGGVRPFVVGLARPEVATIHLGEFATTEVKVPDPGAAVTFFAFPVVADELDLRAYDQAGRLLQTLRVGPPAGFPLTRAPVTEHGCPARQPLPPDDTAPNSAIDVVQRDAAPTGPGSTCWMPTRPSGPLRPSTSSPRFPSRNVATSLLRSGHGSSK